MEVPVFIEVAKGSFVPVHSIKFLKGKNSQMLDNNTDKTYLIKDCLQNENILSCGDYKSDTLNNSVNISVPTLSENLLKLKKGQWLAEITIAECGENKPIEINSVCSNNFNIKEIDLSHLQNGFDKGKLKNILIDYYNKIRDKNVNESTKTTYNCMTIHQGQVNHREFPILIKVKFLNR